MKIIVITPEKFLPNEAECIIALFQSGIELLHLRKPNATEQEVAELLEQIPREYRKQVVIHYHHPLAERYALRGVHLSARSPHPPEGYGGAVSKSCHTLAELQRLDGAAYGFLSPLYNSISKEGYNAAFTPQVLQQAAHAGIINSRVVALGGITPTHIPTLKKYGFGGVALLGYIWSDSRPEILEQKIAAVKQALQISEEQ